MKASNLVKEVQDLVDQEQQLNLRRGLSMRERARLDHIGSELDRCWNVLWQREISPQHAGPRNAACGSSQGTVDDYWW